jgi:hypothetical protein
VVVLGGDLMFVASFFVLAGEFWDKVRQNFLNGARAILPGTDGAEGGRHE